MSKEFSCRFDGRMDRQPFIIILIFVIFFVLWDFSAYVSLSYIIYYITIRGAPRPTCLLKNKKSQTVTPWINSHCYGIMHIRRSGGMQHLSLYINNTNKLIKISTYVKKTRSHGLYTNKRSPGGLAVVRARADGRPELIPEGRINTKGTWGRRGAALTALTLTITHWHLRHREVQLITSRWWWSKHRHNP